MRSATLSILCGLLMLGCQSDAEKACEHIQSLREEGSLPAMKSFDGDACIERMEKMQEKCEYVAECITKVEAGEPLATALQLGACTAECGDGEDAVAALGALAEKTCRCNGGASCLIDAQKQAREWVETYGESTGGDQDKAATYAQQIAKCSRSVAQILVDAAE